MHFPEKDKIFWKLDKILVKPEKIIVWVSGWPDSSFLITLLQDYYEKNWWDEQLLVVAHFNHGQRKESDKEQKEIFKKYKFHHIYYNEEKPKKWQNETTLRRLRKEFFQEILTKEAASYLALGHNLDDRIETSFINLLRGTSLQGLANMTFCDYREWKFYLRPLIDLQKRYIEELCKSNKVSYFTDETNKLSSLTIRNSLRNEIFPQIQLLRSSSRRYDSWLLIYEQIERAQIVSSSDNVWLIPLSRFPKAWGASYCYHIKIWSPNRWNDFVENDRAYVFQQLGIYKKISQKTLAEWTIFSNTSDDWYKLLEGVYFFKSHGKLYAIDGKKEFRNYSSNEQKNITTKEEKIMFDNVKIAIKKERKGGTIRYTKQGDAYKWKRAKKWMLNQKIPVFWRDFVPVIEKKGKIIDVVKEVVPRVYLK